MLFLTNRAFNEGIQTIIGRTVTFDLDNNSPANSIYFCERKNPYDYYEVGSENFLERIRKSFYKQVLLYVHGFNCLPEDTIFKQAQILQDLFDVKEKNLILVLPIIWPCDNDLGIVRDYWDDQKAADMSAFSIARALSKFLEFQSLHQAYEKCTKHINILAHSMGNRVLRESLRVWSKYDLQGKMPQIFRTIFMVAADLVNESLEKDQEGELIPISAKNVCVYYAGDDLALRSSKIANLKNNIASRRLGHTGPEDLNKLPFNVFSFDCDNFNNKYDNPVGHTYFMSTDNTSTTEAGILFEHLYNTLVTGRPTYNNIFEKRVVLG